MAFPTTVDDSCAFSIESTLSSVLIYVCTLSHVIARSRTIPHDLTRPRTSRVLLRSLDLVENHVACDLHQNVSNIKNDLLLLHF